MADTITIEAGSLPVSRGAFVDGTTQPSDIYKFNRFTYLGSEFEATIDHPTTTPGSLSNGYPVANTGWRVVAVGAGAETAAQVDANTRAIVGQNARINALELEAQDLSMRDNMGNKMILRNTANTYVVRAAGTYCIPLVYGNGIKNSKENAQAYTRQGSTYTAAFVNHLGNAITSPYIEKNSGCEAGSVGLLWQTGTGLISAITLEPGTDCRYIRFTAGSIPATNGLAIIFVKDLSGKIMWSWTLWLTTDNLDFETIQNHTDVDYEMMPEALGTIWNADRTRCVNPHFQWGRKDPMCPPSAYNSNSNMSLYDIDGNAYSGWGVLGTDGDQLATKTVANAIQNPNLFFTRYDSTNHNWNNLAWFNNFWAANITGSGDLADNQDTAIKTIYDPCPPFTMLPAGRAWTGFTTDGGNHGDSLYQYFNVVDKNGSGDISSADFTNGWWFKKNASDDVGTYYPASGYRYYGSGGLFGVGSDGYYWSFAPYSQTGARYLGFDSGGVGPLGGGGRAGGFSVRPAKELS